jgi:hypothetical protein
LSVQGKHAILYKTKTLAGTEGSGSDQAAGHPIGDRINDRL